MSSRSRPRSAATAGRPPSAVPALLVLALTALSLCCFGAVLIGRGIADSVAGVTPTAVRPSPTPLAGGAGVLRIAAAPESLATLQPLATEFNRTGQGTVSLIAMSPGDMVDALRAGQPPFDAAIPDSSFWLPRLDQAWSNAGKQESLTGLVRRFMLTPVVIATWEQTAPTFGSNPGWADFLQRAESDSSFRWSHPSAKTGPGFLAILGEIYFAAGKSWGLTQADLDRQATRDTFGRIEKSVAQYGESEDATMQALADKGPAYLSAFVATERAVLRYNSGRTANRLRAIYPREGAAWADYPLALLDGEWVSPQLRTLYVAFADYLVTARPQAAVLAAGFRPVSPDISLTSATSPFAAANGVDPRQPRVALQIPEESLVDRILTLWTALKRHSRQVWVVDTSGSMGDSQKLQRVKSALLVLIDQASENDEVGLIKFSDRSQLMVPIGQMTDLQKETLRRTVQGMTANGNTALLDAALEGYNLLTSQPTDRIRGLILLTDGEENRSTNRMSTLTDAIKKGNQKAPVVVFCIAYGGDAGTSTLTTIAAAAGAVGQVRSSDPASIQRLYEDLQKYF